MAPNVPNGLERPWSPLSLPAMRPLHPLLLLLLALLTTLPSLTVVRESFWIDELHSVWVVLGEWNDIPARAWEGNQTPLYFYWLKLWGNGLGFTEPALRVLSWLCMTGAIWLAYLTLQRSLFPQGKLDLLESARNRLAISIGCMMLWGWLDWSMWFYATEVRPYAFVTLALFGLLWLSDERRDSRRPGNFGWVVVSILAIHLHLTAGLWVFCHWLIRLGQLSQRPIGRKLMIRVRLWELLLVGIGSFPLLGLAAMIWDRSSQWETMSGIVDGPSLLRVIPWIPWVVIPGLGFAVTRQRSERDSTVGQGMAVVFGPLLMVVVVSGLQWAPMLHRRYVIGSHLAAWWLGGWWLSQLPVRWKQVAVGVLSCGAMIAIDGNWRVWQEGEWMAWPRQENWQAAVEWLNTHAEANSEIWVSPQLVETMQVDSTPLPYPASRYYPLFVVHARYLLRSDLECRLLANDPRSWKDAMSADLTKKRFLLVRQGSLRLDGTPWEATAIHFGRVAVAPVAPTP